ncbi:hypothetical protein PG993_005509 [Apiospora rasikravindrae]|uniref:Uncharacterized protein n=1 Tax=Apiospora rasikravindrae TaxID=990691 RepID=A0ABR1THQ3_9PEZI
MNPMTYLEKWDLSLPISSTKARRRREEMLKQCAKVPGWQGKIKMLVMAEHHVCRFLWELHHRGKMPEDRFCWLVDQVLFRFAEARVPSAVAITLLEMTLGPMPPMRVDYKVEKASGVWEKYEGIIQERAAKEEEKQKRAAKGKEKEQQKPSESPPATFADVASKK